MTGLGQAALQGRGATGLVALHLLAAAPPLAVALWQVGLPAVQVLAAALGTALFWDAVFAKARRHPLRLHGLSTAAIFALFLPTGMPVWHLLVVLSLATVVGEHVFGGRGYGFLSPATVALALALLSLPDLVLPVPSAAVALACIPGLALLIATGLCSPAILAAFGLVLAAAHAAAGTLDPMATAIAALPALLFLVSDPTASAATAGGRLLHGATAAAFVWGFGGLAGDTADIGAFVFAALVASLFAPLLDHLAIGLQRLADRGRHG